MFSMLYILFVICVQRSTSLSRGNGHTKGRSLNIYGRCILTLVIYKECFRMHFSVYSNIPMFHLLWQRLFQCFTFCVNSRVKRSSCVSRFPTQRSCWLSKFAWKCVCLACFIHDVSYVFSVRPRFHEAIATQKGCH